MLEYIDQMNNTIRLVKTPRRIVSLVPSQTELLHALGMEEEVVGITKFCIHPDKWFKSKERVGGTKSVNLEKVQVLKPDLIIANKEENSKEDIAKLSEICPVWISDISDLSEALEMIKTLGSIVNKDHIANSIIEETNMRFDLLSKEVSKTHSRKKVLYFIWNEPNFLAGKSTFIDDMLSKCGLNNISSDFRYPEASGIENPDLVFLSSEPFPFKDKHVKSFKQIYPSAEIVLVDGEMFSWYGSRLPEAASYFMNLIVAL